MRYKGQRTPRQVDREYPHQLEIAVPEGGLGKRLNELHAACGGIDYATRGIDRKQWMATGRDGVRFCFKTAEQAGAFHARFGGKRLTIA